MSQLKSELCVIANVEEPHDCLARAAFLDQENGVKKEIGPANQSTGPRGN